MPWIDSADRYDIPLDPHQTLSVYNGMDCALTFEIWEAIHDQLDNDTNKIYEFSRALQAPVMDMTLRGVRVDLEERRRCIGALKEEGIRFQSYLDRLGEAVFDAPINPESPAQLKDLFYDTMQIPAIKSRKGREWKVSTDRAALEKIRESYSFAAPIAELILHIRDINSQLELIERGVDSDGRMRCSYNIAGTITGRFSSSKNIYGTGGNLQNITERIRQIFVSDPGLKLAYLDLEQAESRAVGLICFLTGGSDTYLKACFSGDLHTIVCRLVWPDLPWTGDGKADRKIADQPFYRTYSYRDMAKRGGHGTNYGGSAAVIASHLKIDRKVAEAFQTAYFEAFPEIKQWHLWVASELANTGVITTPFGRRRHFFGRRDENKTRNEAIAFGPQSLVADMLNTGMLEIYKLRYRDNYPIDLLMQVHDAVVIQYPCDLEYELMPLAIKALETPLPGHNFFIPAEGAVGWNWAKQITNKEGKVVGNPFGLVKWKPAPWRDERKILTVAEAMSALR